MEDEIIIMPYIELDGIRTYSDTQVKALYQKVWDEGLGEDLFHDGSIKDADHFVQLMKSPWNFLHVIYVGEKVVAVSWVNRVEETHCWCHFVFFKEFHGDSIIYAVGNKYLNYLLDTYGFEVIMGLIPATNEHALMYVRGLGWKIMGSVPGMLWSRAEEKPVDGVIVYVNKEMLANALQVTRTGSLHETQSP